MTIDFSRGIHPEKGESIIDASYRAKRLAFEQRANERLEDLVREFLQVFAEFDSQMPKGEAARSLERHFVENLADFKLVILMLDQDTAGKKKLDPGLLDRLHKAALR